MVDWWVGLSGKLVVVQMVGEKMGTRYCITTSVDMLRSVQHGVWQRHEKFEMS